MFAYLDHAATTAVCPEAAQAALEEMTAGFGNPSARCAFGQEAAKRLEARRAVLAQALGCSPEEVTFLSCGTEGDNWAIQAAVELGRRRGKHIITTAIEHSAVLEPLKALEGKGYSITRLKPDKSGHVSPDDLRAALRDDTVLVSMMLVNNELGTIQPVAECVRIAKAFSPEILFHTDAVQGFLKVPFTVDELGVDLLTISGHKIRAPKGIGVQYIRKGLKLPPLIRGGGQEKGLRSGTEATHQIAALAAACQLWLDHGDEYRAHMAELKAYALDQLRSKVDGLEVVSAGDAPHICAVSLPGYPSEMLVRALSDQGICVSSGSACHKGKPSHVFAALGLPKRTLMGVLRVSFGPGSTKEEVDALADALAAIRNDRVGA
ncbi:cysteine desulfurase family protein [Pseudoflavonifractor sp. MSJ-37]|uniref:cysteine desulfurase family protein n=1 Tax=Pseudoflavonifractor sp. MSJ-37 TaxID=2841531 RepID=UPI001C127216|nr:cysteine desulfurase family protein [Pseudoflavonifractor sp. MSJ-37]MBU5434549.1 cysteine desulfurase [Pseudoflavonifractor sp. MSJ-37]